MAEDDAPAGETVEAPIHDPQFKHLWWEFAAGAAILAFVFTANAMGWAFWITTNAHFDTFMPYLAGTAPDEARERRFLFIDIDAATFRRLGDPLVTPRDRIADLLKFATGEKGGKPTLVILDVAIGHRSDELTGRRPHNSVSTNDGPKRDCADQTRARLPIQSDKALWDFFCDYRGEDKPPIILARAFDLDTLALDGLAHQSPEPSFLGRHPTVRPLHAFTDDQATDLGKGTPQVFWASPLFGLDDQRFVREARLWSSICFEGAFGILPSIQLLAVALINDHTEPHAPIIPALERWFLAIASAHKKRAAASKDPCRLPLEPTSPTFAPIPLSDDGPRIDLQGNRLAQHLLYTLPWKPKQEKIAFERMKLLPAWVALDAVEKGEADDARLDGSILDGRIVVIGSSSPKAKDLHRTPIGVMPGAMVLINAIQSLASYGTLRAPSPWIRVPVATAFLVVVICLFFFLNFRLATTITGALLLVTGLLILMFGLRGGHWLDFALPAAAVLLYRMLLPPLNAVRKLRTQGMRAFLHPRFHRDEQATADRQPPTSKPTLSKKMAPSIRRKPRFLKRKQFIIKTKREGR